MSVNFTFLDFPQLQQPTHFLYSFLVMLCSLSQLCRLFVTPWTVARQAPLSVGILQARILEWVAMPSSKRSS